MYRTDSNRILLPASWNDTIPPPRNSSGHHKVATAAINAFLRLPLSFFNKSFCCCGLNPVYNAISRYTQMGPEKTYRSVYLSFRKTLDTSQDNHLAKDRLW